MKITLSTGQSFDVLDGESVFKTLKRYGIHLVASCGGQGICSKCRIRVIDGKYESLSKGKLRQGDIESGIVLACQTFPAESISVDIPQESLLVVGEKIALSKSGDLLQLLKSFSVKISPIVKWIELELPPPTISDNISDLERLKRSLAEKGLTGMRFSYQIVSQIAEILRIADWKIIVGYTNAHDIVHIAPAKINRIRYGIAVDIGTTTVVVYLVNLDNGQLIDVGSTYNSQIKYGDDVITRIIYSVEQKGLEELREAVVSDINDLINLFIEKHNIEINDIVSAVIAGNTTMSHIFWGFDPVHIREEPYIPTVNFFPRWRGGLSRLNINSMAPVLTLPCVASYVGGDIVSGVLASQMHRNSEIALFMDIGTNGEIAIGNNEWLVTASCSAGPCFEGSGIKHGMRATAGAIESIIIEPETYKPILSVNGNGEPLGICGSGMIDAVSEMFLKGIINQKGKFVTDLKTNRIRNGPDGTEFLIYSRYGKDIVLTEVDIENILRAKAAMYAGVSLLLNEVGLTIDAIKKIYIAGGFGNYLDVHKAIIMGMLPDLPKERFSFIGNACITGAYLCLLSDELRKEAGIIASKMTYIELSVSRRFMDEYLSALFLPHTDISLFPTVRELISKNRYFEKI